MKQHLNVALKTFVSNIFPLVPAICESYSQHPVIISEWQKTLIVSTLKNSLPVSGTTNSVEQEAL